MPKRKDVRHREQESPNIGSSVPTQQKPQSVRGSKTGLYLLLEGQRFRLDFPSVFHVMLPSLQRQPSPAQMSADLLAEPITIALGPL